MKKTPKSFADLPPIRVRKEPPTVVEAVAAAQDLADDVEQQVEIAAGLIGLAPDEVRPHVLSAAKERRERPRDRLLERGFERGPDHRMPERVTSPGSQSRAPRTVVVERRSRPTVVVERRGPRPLEPRR